MNEENIRKSWKSLLKSFIIGLIILVISQIVYHFGGRSMFMIGFYGSILGFTFIAYTCYQMIKLKKIIKEKRD